MQGFYASFGTARIAGGVVLFLVVVRAINFVMSRRGDDGARLIDALGQEFVQGASFREVSRESDGPLPCGIRMHEIFHFPTRCFWGSAFLGCAFSASC